MSETPTHTYPSAYRPGCQWAIDEAWAILDMLQPGLVRADTRAFLAGAIAQALMRVSQAGQREQAPAMPAPLSPTALLTQLAGYDPQTLARWWAEINVWRWPADCPVPAPEGWETAYGGGEQARLSDPLWEVLDSLVAPEDASRAHWVHVLGKTDEEWATWWDARARRGLHWTKGTEGGGSRP